jgi:chromosomal replication initiator protein
MSPEIWEQIRGSLKESLEEHHFQTWIQPIQAEVGANQTLTLKVPNKFVRDWIRDHYYQLILTELKTFTEQEWSLNFIIDEQGAVSQDVSPVTPPKEPKTEIKPNYQGLNIRYTFDQFVVGASNQFAHATSQAVAKAPGQQYNPLFIYGGVGLGKTHLLHAIGLEILKRNPQSRIHFVSSEKFMNELIYAIRFDKMNYFRQKYRQRCDVLLIDDIQFIAGKERTQEEFFHTFNALYEDHSQIVLTSDKFPKEIPGLEDRLRSRFEWGLIADIQTPDLETRMAIIKKKAAQESITLSNEVVLYLATHIKSNVRELEGALIRLSAFASLSGATISTSLAQDVLKNIISRAQAFLSVELVQKTVADFYKIKLSDLLGAKRFKSFSLPRQIAMYLCRKHIKASYPELGHKFGGKDHSTVVHAVAKIGKMSASQPEFERELSIIESRLDV